jgi:hypothetical protein
MCNGISFRLKSGSRVWRVVNSGTLLVKDIRTRQIRTVFGYRGVLSALYPLHVSGRPAINIVAAGVDGTIGMDTHFIRNNVGSPRNTPGTNLIQPLHTQESQHSAWVRNQKEGSNHEFEPYSPFWRSIADYRSRRPVASAGRSAALLSRRHRCFARRRRLQPCGSSSLP